MSVNRLGVHVRSSMEPQPRYLVTLGPSGLIPLCSRPRAQFVVQTQEFGFLACVNVLHDLWPCTEKACDSSPYVCFKGANVQAAGFIQANVDD